MIESKNDTSKNLEKALQALEQAKQLVANEKKKQNEKKHEGELNRILSVALQTRECQRVPLIGKKTGQQKVDNRNRKQWKCQTIESNDWNSQENAKIWRKDLADTINATNEQLGIAVHWEHHSFKEQGKTESRQHNKRQNKTKLREEEI